MFEAWKPVTLCRRTADTSGIGQELAADEDLATSVNPDVVHRRILTAARAGWMSYRRNLTS